MGAFASAYEKRIRDRVLKILQPIFNECVNEAADITYADLANYIEKTFKESVDDFYSSYSPGYYDRNYSLREVLSISRPNGKISVKFSSDKMASNEGTLGSEGLYEQTFLKGWHGGADHATKGKPHPNPGAPYWRTPYGIYKYWGRPAAISAPPFYEIKEKSERYWQEVSLRKFQSTLRKLFAEKTQGIDMNF